MDSSNIRENTHAGSWYLGEKNQLDNQLYAYISKAQKEVETQKIKAIIGPHAGHRYSGPTAAWAYKYLTPQENLRVFLLGPCHRVYMEGIGLSKLSSYQTPLGDIPLDRETIDQMAKELKTGFVFTTKDIEEDEHSLELHLPFIYKMLKDKPFKLVPIMVGNTDPNMQYYLGNYLSKYFDDPNTIFVISSDFCHWGKGFRFQYYQQEDGAVYQSIEKLDKQGAKFIENHDTKQLGFQDYLSTTKNTICGRHPIGVLLNIINNSSLKEQLKTKLVHYSQSSQAESQNDQSVSYAALITYL